ncbi:MAG: DUF2254 domain-containing protein [Syntrophotaleaceae bacterium]
MGDRIRFFLRRLGEKLWVKPLVMCIFSIAAVFLTKTVDYAGLDEFFPDITRESIEVLLVNLSASMLVIATFAVGSMVQAYASASKTATPRCFSLIVADDVSQNALSTFIGVFIFSIIAIIPLKNGYYDIAGRFALFALTLVALVIVVLTLVRWIDRIARLGRLGTTISKVEAATTEALLRRRGAPYMKALPLSAGEISGLPVYSEKIGYVQRVDVSELQSVAKKQEVRIAVASLPGTFCVPGKPLVWVRTETGESPDIDTRAIAKAFRVGKDRTFDEDPRFGFIVLAEIADRALSPAVNDPGTAIDVINVSVRLFALWTGPVEARDKIEHDRVEVPGLSTWDMLDDIYTPIADSGADSIEVVIRLLKAFHALASMGDLTLRDAALYHARLAAARADIALALPEDRERVRKVAAFEGDLFREV